MEIQLRTRRVELGKDKEAMARAIERIEQDLATLEDAIALLRAEFHSSYSQYLSLLGQAVRQQLILASYQVCTQGYPESFLGLSFDRRQTLQQALRQLGRRTQEQLLSHLEESQKVSETDATDKPELTPPQLPDSSEPDQSSQDDEEQLSEPLEIQLDSDSPLDVSEPSEIDTPPSMKPEQLVQWQDQLEEAIAQTLQTFSLDTNRLLQESGIIPDKLPAAVLEAAAKADASTESITAGSPNLLNLLMETENEGDSEDSKLMRIVAVNLRLSEIEFADPALSAVRNQIRNLSNKGSKLQREYNKKQRERAVARAEAAWRASWFDD
jgi:hypothetical protein